MIFRIQVNFSIGTMNFSPDKNLEKSSQSGGIRCPDGYLAVSWVDPRRHADRLSNCSATPFSVYPPLSAPNPIKPIMNRNSAFIFPQSR